MRCGSAKLLPSSNLPSSLPSSTTSVRTQSPGPQRPRSPRGDQDPSHPREAPTHRRHAPRPANFTHPVPADVKWRIVQRTIDGRPKAKTKAGLRFYRAQARYACERCHKVCRNQHDLTRHRLACRHAPVDYEAVCRFCAQTFPYQPNCKRVKNNHQSICPANRKA